MNKGVRKEGRTRRMELEGKKEEGKNRIMKELGKEGEQENWIKERKEGRWMKRKE